MQNIPNRRFAHAPLGALVSLLFSTTPLPAQSVLPGDSMPPAAKLQPAPSTASNEVVELSPFSVNATQDTGWRAQNTLAGSRMNSSLKDTPGVLDVLTKEFLDDFGVITLDQALGFAANFEDTSAGDEGVNSAYPGANQGMNFNIRGQGGSLARNFLSTHFRPEFYTVERIDNSSGPNAILFGVGSAGGVANISTKRAKLFQDAATFDFRTDDYGSLRATIDTNKIFIPKKLALRVNAIASRGKGYRDYSDSNIDGVHLALKARPFDNTEINVEYERDRSSGLISDPRPVHERITNWLDAGSQTITVPTNWDTLTAAARTTLLASYASLGVHNLSTADSPVYVGGNQPYMINAKNTLRSIGSNQLVQNDALVPYTLNPSGPGGLKEINRHVLALSIEQKVARNLYVNVSLSREGGDAATYQSFRGTGGARPPCRLIPTPL